jgi:hypothetical protein
MPILSPMQQLVGYARSVFWTVGVIQILAGLYVAFTIGFGHRTSSHPVAVAAAILLCFLVVGLGILSCLAARAWRHKTRFAKPLVAISSLLCLIAFPFGTVAGAVGLWWCFSRKMQDLEPPVGDYEHQPKPEDGTHAWVQKAIPALTVGIWLSAFAILGLWGHAYGLPSRGVVDGLVLLFICEWISVFLHETGHAIAGWASGMSLASFRVGPFIAQKDAGRWKFLFSLPALLTSGGGVSTIPLHLNHIRSRMAFEVAGGPVASLVTAIIAALIVLLIPGSGWEAWWKFPAMTAVISAGAAVLNLIPFGFAAGYSDGALLVQLLRGGRFADLREALKMVSMTIVTPTRPRDLDARALAEGMRAGVGTPEEGTLSMIQLICAVDRGELIQARAHLESSLQRIPAPENAQTPGCAAEMAFYIAYLDGNADRAEKWLRGAEDAAASKKFSLTTESDYWRAMTAVHEAEGHRSQAEDAYQKAMEILAKKPVTGLYQFEREFLQTVRKGEWVNDPAANLREASA